MPAFVDAVVGLPFRPLPSPVRFDTPSDEIALFYFDVLGFSERVREVGLDSVYALYRSLATLVDNAVGGRVVLRRTGSAHPSGAMPTAGYLDLQAQYASDTVLLWASGADLHFEAALDVAIEFFCACFTAGLPLRGAITFGRAVMDRQTNIYLGQPIIEAARAETAQQWAGCSFGPSVARYGSDLCSADLILPYGAQVKGGREADVRPVAIDWPRRMRARMDEARILRLVDSYRRPGFEAYWDATAAFVRYSSRHPCWWEEPSHTRLG